VNNRGRKEETAKEGENMGTIPKGMYNDERERKTHVKSCEGRNEAYSQGSGRENK
jgi:hypothetical protein